MEKNWKTIANLIELTVYCQKIYPVKKHSVPLALAASLLRG